MKITLCLGLIGGTCITMLWAPKFSPESATESKPGVHHSSGAIAHELIGELSGGGIGRSMQPVATENIGSTISFPKRQPRGSNAELYSVDEDGSSGKYWLGVAHGTIKLPKRGAIHLALSENEQASFELLRSLKSAGINTIEIPRESASQRVIIAASKVPGVRGLKLYGGKLRSATVAGLANQRLNSLILMNVQTDEQTLQSITRLPALTQLKCIGMKLPGSFVASLRKLSKLTDIDLDNCTLPTNAVDDLARIKTLQRLSLADTGLGDSDCRTLSKAVGLQSLSLERNEISDIGVRALRPLVNLQNLELKLTNVTDQSSKIFCSLPKLTRLDLAYTHVTDAIAEPLSDTHIANLSLVGTSIGDEGASKFSRTVALKRLVLDDTAVTDATIEGLRNKHESAQIY